MKLEEFRQELEALRDKELYQYAQRCVCLSIADTANLKAESHSMLDFIYAEFTRRGKERLYDKAYETVCREPNLCSGFSPLELETEE